MPHTYKACWRMYSLPDQKALTLKTWHLFSPGIRLEHDSLFDVTCSGDSTGPACETLRTLHVGAAMRLQYGLANSSRQFLGTAHTKWLVMVHRRSGRNFGSVDHGDVLQSCQDSYIQTQPILVIHKALVGPCDV